MSNPWKPSQLECSGHSPYFEALPNCLATKQFPPPRSIAVSFSDKKDLTLWQWRFEFAGWNPSIKWKGREIIGDCQVLLGDSKSVAPSEDNKAQLEDWFVTSMAEMIMLGAQACGLTLIKPGKSECLWFEGFCQRNKIELGAAIGYVSRRVPVVSSRRYKLVVDGTELIITQ